MYVRKHYENSYYTSTLWKLLATHVPNVNVCQMIGVDKSSNF